MLDVRCELRDEGEVSRLPWRSLGNAVDGVHEWLVISEGSEREAFKVVSEVFDGTKDCEELPVKRSIFLFGRRHFP